MGWEVRGKARGNGLREMPEYIHIHTHTHIYICECVCVYVYVNTTCLLKSSCVQKHRLGKSCAYTYCTGSMFIHLYRDPNYFKLYFLNYRMTHIFIDHHCNVPLRPINTIIG